VGASHEDDVLFVAAVTLLTAEWMFNSRETYLYTYITSGADFYVVT